MKNYIPTINISSLLKSNFNSRSATNTLKKIEQACVEVGFFQVTGHGIDIKKIDNICKIGDKFFNSSEKNKKKLAPKKWNKKNKNVFKNLSKKLPKYIYSFPIEKKEITKAILSNKNNYAKKKLFLKKITDAYTY